MSLLFKKGSGTVLFLLALGMSFVLVSSWTAPAVHAYTGGSVVVDPGQRGVNDPSAGDPDGPNDTPPTTQGGISVGGGSTSSTVETPSIAPAKRGGLWAHWMLALKIAARVTFHIH